MYETSNAGKYQPVVIGIDHGFSLIKTYHHIMSNGVSRTSGKPPVLENSLYYDGKEYTVEELFCCSYAPFFWQAVQIRYPEYATYNHKLYALFGGQD